MTSVHDYLNRIGIDAVPAVDALGLRALHEAHLATVPFENLSIALGERIELDEQRLLDKVVGARRGGFCYELNGAFAWLLRRVGFAVECLEARVFSDGEPGPPFDHMVLRVNAGEPFLADVGFGDSFLTPLRFHERAEQLDRTGAYRLVPVDDITIDLLRDSAPQFRLSREPHELAEFAGMCDYHQTSAESHFKTGTICSLPTPEGRITIRNRTRITTSDGERTEHPIESDEELRALLEDRFGIALDSLP